MKVNERCKVNSDNKIQDTVSGAVMSNPSVIIDTVTNKSICIGDYDEVSRIYGDVVKSIGTSDYRYKLIRYQYNKFDVHNVCKDINKWYATADNDDNDKREELIKIRVKYFTDIEPLQKISKGDWIDLRAAETVELKRFDDCAIPLGIAMELPVGYEALIAPRNSTYKRYGVMCVNSIGVVDNAYNGDNDQWCFPCVAMRDTVIHKGDRICQFRIIKNQETIEFDTVETLGNTDRGGFGSTGVN